MLVVFGRVYNSDSLPRQGLKYVCFRRLRLSELHGPQPAATEARFTGSLPAVHPLFLVAPTTCRKASFTLRLAPAYSPKRTIVMPEPPRSACSSVAETTSGTVRR